MENSKNLPFGIFQKFAVWKNPKNFDFRKFQKFLKFDNYKNYVNSFSSPIYKLSYIFNVRIIQTNIKIKNRFDNKTILSLFTYSVCDEKVKID